MRKYIDICFQLLGSKAYDPELFKLCICGVIKEMLRGKIKIQNSNDFTSKLYIEYGILFDECLELKDRNEVNKCVKNTIDLILKYVLLFSQDVF